MTQTHNKMKQFLSLLLAVTFAFSLFVATPVTAQAAGRKAAGIESLLNAAPLTPTPTGSASADAYIAAVLAQVTTPQMSTYQKVKAVYDYLIAHTSYDPDIAAGINIPNDVFYASYDVMIGYATLVSGRGVCDTYSCAFTMIMRYLGLNSYVIGGQTHRASGGYTPHAWSVILLNGIEYIFDAQIDDNIARGGKTGYYRFGKTYAQVPDKYIPQALAYFQPMAQQQAAAPAAAAQTADGFDAAFYAALYPDVVAVFGTDPAALYNHYITYGKNEGRFPNLAAVPGI